MRCRFILLFFLLLIINSAIAQWRFTVTIVDYNANCSSMSASIEVAVWKDIVTQLSGQTYDNQADCESERRNCMINYSSGGCYIRTTTTPCQGNTGGIGATGIYYGEQSLYNSLGTEGFTFSPTERDINQNTYEEYQMRQDAFGYNSGNAQTINPNMMSAKTGDNDFDNTYMSQIKSMKNENGSSDSYSFKSRWEIDPDKPLHVRQFEVPPLDDDEFRYGGKPNLENLNIYLSISNDLTDLYLSDPQFLEQILQEEFKRVSGYNVQDILNKYPTLRTEEEKQILYDYGAFKTSKVEEMYDEIKISIDNTPEKKEIDAAILALDAYGTDEDGFLNQTNFKKVDIETLLSNNNPSEYDPINALSYAIKSCNDMGEVIGFKAELYYNEITNTYVISFAGTEMTDINDWLNDVNIGIKAILNADNSIPQYDEALSKIARAINDMPYEEREKFNLEVVGHSLGGGLASVIGLATGIETKTFNAATVPEQFLKDNGLFDKVQNGDVQNITAYHTSTDILTIAQQTAGIPAIGIPADIGDPATTTEKNIANGVGTAVGSVVPGGTMVGGSVGEKVAGHRMGPMARSIYNSNTEKIKPELSALDRLQSELKRAEMWNK